MQIFISLLLMLTPLWVLHKFIAPMKDLRKYSLKSFQYVLMAVSLATIAVIGFLGLIMSIQDPSFTVFNLGL